MWRRRRQYKLRYHSSLRLLLSSEGRCLMQKQNAREEFIYVHTSECHAWAEDFALFHCAREMRGRYSRHVGAIFFNFLPLRTHWGPVACCRCFWGQVEYLWLWMLGKFESASDAIDHRYLLHRNGINEIAEPSKVLFCRALLNYSRQPLSLNYVKPLQILYLRYCIWRSFNVLNGKAWKHFYREL